MTVTAHLKDGSRVSETCRSFKGSAVNPMSREERMAKVWDCIGRALSKPDAERVIGLLEDLENVADIGTLMQVMGQSSMESS